MMLGKLDTHKRVWWPDESKREFGLRELMVEQGFGDVVKIILTNSYKWQEILERHDHQRHEGTRHKEEEWYQKWTLSKWNKYLDSLVLFSDLSQANKVSLVSVTACLNRHSRITNLNTHDNIQWIKFTFSTAHTYVIGLHISAIVCYIYPSRCQI